MKKTKRLLSLMLCVVMALSIISMPASAYYNVTMYAPDGRTIVVDNYDVSAWKNVGWYDYPVVAMYAPDGRSIVVAESDVWMWSNVGWIDGRLTTTIYAPDGRTATIPAWQLQSYLNVGWYDYNPSPYSVSSYDGSYYSGTNLPKYDYVVNGYYLDSFSKYTDSGSLMHIYEYQSTLSNKSDYVDYLKSIGWDYLESEVYDDYSEWFLTYGNQIVGVFYYFGEDFVRIIYGNIY